MEEAVLFRILDATGATPEQIRRYLKIITGQTELNAVYSENGNYKITKEVADRENSTLIGLQVANVVVFSKRIVSEDFIKDRVSVDDIRERAKNIHPKAKPMNKAHLSLLLGCEDDYKRSVDRLIACGFDIKYLPEYFVLIEEQMYGNISKLPFCDISGLNKQYSYISNLIKDHTILVYCDIDEL